MKDQANAIRAANGSFAGRVDNSRVFVNWVKALQYSDNGRCPHELYGWNPVNIVDLLPLFDEVAFTWTWDRIFEDDRRDFQERALRTWLQLSKRWTPDQYWTQAPREARPMIMKDYVPRANQGGEFGNRLAFLLVPRKNNQPSRLEQHGDVGYSGIS